MEGWDCQNCGAGIIFACSQDSRCLGSLGDQGLVQCGVCGPPPGGGGGGGTWTPAECYSQNQNIIENPSYKFSIYNPAGEEKAYITAEGYLFMTGNGADDGGSIIGGLGYEIGGYANAVDWYISTDMLCGGGNTPSGVFRINNSQGIVVAAFAACPEDPDLSLLMVQSFADGQPYDPNAGIKMFVQGDYSGSGNLIIANDSDLTSAWFDNNGVLYLKACYAHP
jgi:hypothetical protein